jgi:hypothetical protein
MICCLLFKYVFWNLICMCRLHNLRSSKFIFFSSAHCFSVLFSFRAHTFFYLGTIRRFSWNGTTVPHWMFHGTHPRIFQNTQFHHFRLKCWVLLKPVLGGVNGNLNFPVPSMNRLNQTPVTFSILSCWDFFRDSVSLYFRTNLIILFCYIRNLFFKTSEKNRIPKESATRQNCKMLQTLFDWACLCRIWGYEACTIQTRRQKTNL